jgi:hypothetical protein
MLATPHPTAGDRTLDAILDDALSREKVTDRLTLAQLGSLLGDDPRVVWQGPQCGRLCSYARAGALVTIENVEWIEHRNSDGKLVARRAREHLQGVHVRREDFASWLSVHGTDEDRNSRAATWAHHTTKGN